MRIQLALNVRDLGEAIDYYSELFAAEPHKIRNGYANFSIDQPPLKLVLFENPEAPERINHLGVEVFDEDQLSSVSRRLQDSGLADSLETNTTCCHATQNKVWSREPQGLRWEWYRITDDNPERDHETQISTCRKDMNIDEKSHCF